MTSWSPTLRWLDSPDWGTRLFEWSCCHSRRLGQTMRARQAARGTSTHVAFSTPPRLSRSGCPSQPIAWRRAWRHLPDSRRRRPPSLPAVPVAGDHAHRVGDPSSVLQRLGSKHAEHHAHSAGPFNGYPGRGAMPTSRRTLASSARNFAYLTLVLTSSRPAANGHRPRRGRERIQWRGWGAVLPRRIMSLNLVARLLLFQRMLVPPAGVNEPTARSFSCPRAAGYGAQ
jgi:hypothetical protein